MTWTVVQDDKGGATIEDDEGHAQIWTPVSE